MVRLSALLGNRRDSGIKEGLNEGIHALQIALLEGGHEARCESLLPRQICDAGTRRRRE